MHEEGCTSRHVPPVPLSRDEDVPPELGDKPNQPKTFTFPKRKFGDKKPTY